MTLNLPRSLLREADELDFEKEAESVVSGLQKRVGETLRSVAPKPPQPLYFQPADDSIIETPIEGPERKPITPFALADDESFFGMRTPMTKPESAQLSAGDTVAMPEAGNPAAGSVGGGATGGGALDAMSGTYQPSNASRHDKLVRIGQVARASGLDDEGARILQAVATTEGGLEGAIGDQGQSRGPYQFYEGGQMPAFRAWLREQGIQGDPNVLVHDVDLATRFAASTYLGAAIARGRAKGLSGSDLATYVQETGQVSETPWKTGDNYRALFGAGADPFAMASGNGRADVGAAVSDAGANGSDGAGRQGSIKGGLTVEQAMAADRADGRATMAYEDLSGDGDGTLGGVPSAPPVRDDYRLTQPPAETVGTPSSPRIPGDAFEPSTPDGLPPSEAPASSGNPIVDLFSEMGRKLSSILQPANDAAVGALNSGAQTIGETFSRGREDPSPSQQLANAALDQVGDLAQSNVENWSNVAAKVTGDRIGHRMTPEEQQAATERALRIVENNPFAPGVYSAMPEVIGVASTSREALDRLAAQRKIGGSLGDLAPSSGVVSRAQADEAAPAMDRYYHGTGSDFARPDPGKFDPNGLFGPGYYVTDDARVAGGTVDDGGKTLGLGYGQQRGQAEAVNAINEAQKQSPEAMARFRELQRLEGDIAYERRERGNTPLVKSLEQRAEHLRAQVEADQLDFAPRTGPNIRPVDVPRDLNLLDADAPIPDSMVTSIMRTIDDPSRRTIFSQEIAHARQFDANNRPLPTVAGALYDAYGDSAGLNKLLADMGYDGIRYAGGKRIPMMDEAGNAIDHNAVVIFPESLDKIRNATAGTPGGFVPGRARDTAGQPGDILSAAGRAVGTGAGAAYDESQQEGATPESILRAGVGGAATSIANTTAGRMLRPGRRSPVDVARVVAQGSDDPKRTRAFSPTDPNVTYDLEHKVVDLRDLITSHGDDFKPNPRFPSELQPRLRDRAAAAQQVQRIANELNPDALLADTRSIQTGSPIVGPDNIVESGNGRVMALRQALKRNPEAAKAYREDLAKAAADYGIDPAELKNKKFPVLVRERLSDVDRKAFAREANESGTAVLSGFERSLGDAELLTDDLIAGLTVGENQSIDQALSAPGNRGILRAFTQSLPANESGTMVDAMGNLSEEGVRRIKQALIIKAYGNSATGQRMARSMIESIDPGVKNVETAIYGSLPSIARVEAVSKRGDLSISTDIAKAADMYARLKQNGISVSDYMTQGSLWERQTTPVQDALIQAFDGNKRSARRIRDILEGYATRAEPQANPSQGDLFGGAVARASKEDILDSAIREVGGVSEEAASPRASAVRSGLDSGATGQRIPEFGDGPRGGTALLDEGAGQPPQRVATGAATHEPPSPAAENRGLYVGEARRRTQKSIDAALAKGEPITLSDDAEIRRLRLDKFPEEIRDELINAARNADWFRTQRRGVVPDVEVQAASSRIWASIDDAIKRGAAGRAYNPEETVALRNMLRGQTEIVQDYTRRLAEPMTKPARDKLVSEQLAEAQKLTALFQVAEGARAEAGRTLRQYREFARSLKDNPEEAGARFIRQRFGNMDGAERVVATYSQMVQDGASPQELAGFLRNVKPAWMDRLNIVRYGSMLSATTTHLRNILGNTINIGQDIALKPVAAGIDAARAAITGGQRTRYLGETSEMARGMLEGMPTGLRDLASTLRTGVNPNEIQTIDNLRGGFGSGSGTLDAIVEGPLRALSGADAFFRAVTLGGHTRAVAFRKASQEGLTGTARAARAQDIVENLYRNLDVLDEASRQSARDILQEDRMAVRGVMQMRDGMNKVVPYLGDVVLPFVRTPMNIAAQGIEMSPLGFASVIKDARAGRVGDATDTAARALFGTALMYGAGTLAMNNMLTGGYPEDARTRSTLPPGWQPYSLKLGDKYIQYSNLGPFGIPIATAVILAEAKKSGKPIDPAAVAMAIGKYMGDQTFMRGISDVVKALNDPGRYGEGVLENIGTQVIPFAALGRQIERAMGMAQKDPHGAWEAMQASYPFSAGNVGDRLDSRGKPIYPSQTGAEAFLSPTNISTEKPDQVLSVLRKQGIGIGAPPNSMVLSDGRNVTLTPQQKQQFQQLLYSEIQDNLIDFNDPATAERAMGQARARARSSLMLGMQ